MAAHFDYSIINRKFACELFLTFVCFKLNLL
jgi:hypothetical protein